MNIFNSLLAQLVKYDVHTTRKINFIHAIFYHILSFSFFLSCGVYCRGVTIPTEFTVFRTIFIPCPHSVSMRINGNLEKFPWTNSLFYRPAILHRHGARQDAQNGRFRILKFVPKNLAPLWILCLHYGQWDWKISSRHLDVDFKNIGLIFSHILAWRGESLF